MKMTRYFTARAARYVCAAMLAMPVFSAQAQQSGQEASTMISFTGKESLRADDAAKILTERLQVNTGTDELRSVYTEKPGDGLQVQRFNQYFKGLRVAHGTYTLSSKDGIASYAFGKFYKIDPATGIIPQLTETEALNKALQSTGANVYQWEVDHTALPTGELQFVEDFTYGQTDGNVRLAYAFDIYANEPLSRNMVYVDAQSGKILFKDAILKGVTGTAASLYSGTVSFDVQLTGSTYYLHDVTRGGGILTYNLNHSTSSSSYAEVTSSSATFPTDPSVDAHWGAQKTYDYWKNVRNRNGWNGTGGQHISYVHYGSSVVNAFWSGNTMNFGDGGSGYSALVSIDVCGHELGHGICQATAGLVYSKESGGMNEGFSDIWGNVIEHWADPHETDAVAKNTWLVGEELGTPLRSMINPKAYGQPNTYQGTNWVYTGAGCDANNDNCGVHTNSGVLNYWFYLLSEGGKGTNDVGNSYQLKGLGIDSAAKIVYATELVLNNTADYPSCRAASIAAATTLYGSCSPQVEAVTRAWYAVNVGANFTPCTPQVSFGGPAASNTEDAGVNDCHASHTVTLPVVLNGPAPTGGSAVVTVTPFGGTAVAGVDYDMVTTTATFPAGSTAAQSVSIKIYDDGAVGNNKYVDFTLSLAPGISNVMKAGIMDTVRLTISNNDQAPVIGATELHSILSSNVTADVTSPFQSKGKGSRAQYIYTAQELSASGLKAGVPITAGAFNVTQKNSGTQAFSGYTMKIAPTSLISITTGFISASFTQVYAANLTTAAGWNTLPFSTPYIWDGVSNLAVEVCFSNTTSTSLNDIVSAHNGGSSAAAATTTATTGGCSLAVTGSTISTANRPVIRFTQNVLPGQIDTTVGDTRTWNVKAAQSVYFNSTTYNGAIAAVLQSNKDLGCVAATVTAAGNGFILASGGKVRSVKEFRLAPAQAVPAGDTFSAIFYFKNTELGDMDPNNAYILQTTSGNDDTLLPSNTKIAAPTDIIYGLDYVGFRGMFTDFGRFYLTNGQLALGVSGGVAKGSEMWTGANPFGTSPVLHWTLASPERVSIRLSDITGKTVYSSEQSLSAGTHQLSLSGNTDYAPGTYILQVVRPSGVFTKQLIK